VHENIALFLSETHNAQYRLCKKNADYAIFP